tara:strand:+ start:384 stop:635 length:252 start_codon:yes stop_codon:yes gene_type:complete
LDGGGRQGFEGLKVAPDFKDMTPETDKAKISRLKSENEFLKEIVRNQYKKALEALHFINKGDIEKIINPPEPDETRIDFTPEF